MNPRDVRKGRFQWWHPEGHVCRQPHLPDTLIYSGRASTPARSPQNSTAKLSMFSASQSQLELTHFSRLALIHRRNEPRMTAGLFTYHRDISPCTNSPPLIKLILAAYYSSFRLKFWFFLGPWNENRLTRMKRTKIKVSLVILFSCWKFHTAAHLHLMDFSFHGSKKCFEKYSGQYEGRQRTCSDCRRELWPTPFPPSKSFPSYPYKSWHFHYLFLLSPDEIALYMHWQYKNHFCTEFASDIFHFLRGGGWSCFADFINEAISTQLHMQLDYSEAFDSLNFKFKESRFLQNFSWHQSKSTT